MFNRLYIFVWFLVVYGHSLTYTQSNSLSLTIVTWNIANFGASKDANEISYIAKKLRNADIVAVQEVSATPPGPQAIAKLVDELNRTGAKWDYVLSEPTNGPGKERYAFLFKTKYVSIKKKGYLIKELDEAIDREPFCQPFEIRYQNKTKEIILLTIHTVPKTKGPEKEIEALARLHKTFIKDAWMIMGDFNTRQNASCFEALKNRGDLSPALKPGVRTTLKMQPDPATRENYANDYDNIYFKSSQFTLIDAGKMDLTLDIPNTFPDLQSIRKISDHVPVYSKIQIAFP